MESSLPPKSERPVSARKPLRQLSLGRGQDLSPASPLISTRNLVPGVSESVVKLDKLGKGATSNVFRAVHAATLKMIALKEVSVSTDADRRAVRTEMRALRTQRSPLLTSTFTTELASCPRIVDYYGSIVRENGNACIAVEYVAGGSLGSWLDNGLRCPEAWIAHIAHQALEALDFVHVGGRVHRDVKPANLLITRNGDLKLADFGAAGVENSARMVGTQRFMAPERLKGGCATAQSDLWSLGLSLATAVLGDSFVIQGSNEFEQLDLAGRARRTLAKATTLSAELTDFLHQCLSRDPARRPALRDLMGHPFLNQRHEWTAKCPEVARGIRDRKRRQREEASALSTDAVLNALCQARAEDNLGDSRVDPATAADLAYELGVTAKSLVRNVHRRTQELILELNGGDVSDSGGESVGVGERVGRQDGSIDSGDGGGCQGGKKARGGIVGDWGRRRHVCHSSSVHGATGGGDGVDSVDLCMDSDGSLSPLGSPRSVSAGVGRAQKMAPMATVNSIGSSSFPLVTPRNRLAAVASGTTGFGRADASSKASRNNSRRALEISSGVKLTPNKRRGERRCLQTRRNGSCCEVDGARRSRGRRERERGNTSSASSRHHHSSCGQQEAKQVDGSGSDCCSKKTGDCRRSLAHRRVEEKPRTAASRTLPSRSHVSLRSMRGVFQLADQMKAEVTVRDRLHRLRVYPDCFSGREAVQWMLEGGHASSVMEAEKLGNEMMKASVFQHILNSHVFEDSSVFYQFTDGETPPPPARGGRRLRQIARVVRGHVARKLVYNGGAGGNGDNFEANLEGILKEAADSECTSKRCVYPGEKESLSRRVAVSSSARTNPPSERSSREVSKTAVSSARPPLSKAGRKKAPPRLPVSSSIDRSKHRRRGRGGQGQSQLRRFSSSMSTATVPETPC